MSETGEIHLPYCKSLVQKTRLVTREVFIGEIPLGAQHPIRIQSMTTADTMDTHATVQECIRMIEAGCEYIRITAPSKKEAENLKNIKAALKSAGFETPLIADIHYTPNAAEIAARLVEKVRINPGNYVDKKKFEIREYTDQAYQEELDRIYERFAPLVKVCKAYGTAMRIGTNHGSLSDRIMSRYGDTPEGMVRSALEFIDICEDMGYYQLVISMKASNTQVMVQAYRLLVANMLLRGKIYPLHLGVTEAGEGADGRIKSALGIGTLLADGIGDTIRVSLTEPPESEMPVARFIARFFNTPSLSQNGNSLSLQFHNDKIPYNPYRFERRTTTNAGNTGGGNVPRVISDFQHLKGLKPDDLLPAGHYFSWIQDKWTMHESGCDYIYTGNWLPDFMLPNGLKAICQYKIWLNHYQNPACLPYFSDYATWIDAEKVSQTLNFVGFTPEALIQTVMLPGPPTVLVLEASIQTSIQILRAAIFKTAELHAQNPIILKLAVDKVVATNDVSMTEALQLQIASLLGTFLIDGLLDGLWLTHKNPDLRGILNTTAFDILQGARLRITKTEYISCPSCGRTLFDLQDTTAKIRSRTEHLKGVKIAIMGCIVNGPGEMADADYGYVGAGPDTISLYRGKDMIEKAIPTDSAVDKLIDIIREDGNWQDPPSNPA